MQIQISQNHAQTRESSRIKIGLSFETPSNPSTFQTNEAPPPSSSGYFGHFFPPKVSSRTLGHQAFLSQGPDLLEEKRPPLQGQRGEQQADYGQSEKMGNKPSRKEIQKSPHTAASRWGRMWWGLHGGDDSIGKDPDGRTARREKGR